MDFRDSAYQVQDMLEGREKRESERGLYIQNRDNKKLFSIVDLRVDTVDEVTYLVS